MEYIILFLPLLASFVAGFFGKLIGERNSEILTSLSEQQEVLGLIRRDNFITVLYKQKSNTVPGEFLGRLVLGLEGDMIKVFGATIY